MYWCSVMKAVVLLATFLKIYSVIDSSRVVWRRAVDLRVYEVYV